MNDDYVCEIPPYTDEQVFQMNMMHGLENLLLAVVELPVTFRHKEADDCPMVSQASVMELIQKFTDDFNTGKIA
jgi:hypothetical protein